MQEKLQKVIDEISEMCEKAHINSNPLNFIHILIAYMRTPMIKSVEDYAINAVVASIICDVIKVCKNKETLMTLSEIEILCNAIKIQEMGDDINEEKLDKAIP